MIQDRFTGSNEPDSVDDSDVVYDATGNRWVVHFDTDGCTVVGDDGCDMFACGETVLSWRRLVDERGPLTTTPEASV